MAYDNSHVWAVGDPLTAAQMTQISDNMAAVYSLVNTRIIEIKVLDDTTLLTTGDGKISIFIPASLNGFNLVDADAAISAVSSSGAPTIQLRNVTDSVDMLSTRITIDANEKTSWTAATPPVIDTSHDDVATGGEIAVDIDVAGTGAKGLTVIAELQKP